MGLFGTGGRKWKRNVGYTQAHESRFWRGVGTTGKIASAALGTALLAPAAIGLAGGGAAAGAGAGAGGATAAGTGAGASALGTAAGAAAKGSVLKGVGGAVAKYAPAVVAGLRGLRRHKNVDWDSISRYVDQIAPQGATADDYAEGERTTSELNDAVGANDSFARADAMTRMIRRGTLTSPQATEGTLTKLDQIKARGRQFARRTGRSQVYQAGLGRLRFRQGLLGQLVGARVNEAVGASRMGDAASADSLSSALQYLQALRGVTSGGGKTPGYVNEGQPQQDEFA